MTRFHSRDGGSRSGPVRDDLFNFWNKTKGIPMIIELLIIAIASVVIDLYRGRIV